jgi:hypothetical protein
MTNELDDLETGFPALVGCGDFSDPCVGMTMDKLTATGGGRHFEVAFHAVLAELRMIRETLVELGGKTY